MKLKKKKQKHVNYGQKVDSVFEAVSKITVKLVIS